MRVLARSSTYGPFLADAPRPIISRTAARFCCSDSILFSSLSLSYLLLSPSFFRPSLLSFLLSDCGSVTSRSLGGGSLCCQLWTEREDGEIRAGGAAAGEVGVARFAGGGWEGKESFLKVESASIGAKTVVVRRLSSSSGVGVARKWRKGDGGRGAGGHSRLPSLAVWR